MGYKLPALPSLGWTRSTGRFNCSIGTGNEEGMKDRTAGRPDVACIRSRSLPVIKDRIRDAFSVS
jgi:hypothetical protein